MPALVCLLTPPRRVERAWKEESLRKREFPLTHPLFTNINYLASPCLGKFPLLARSGCKPFVAYQVFAKSRLGKLTLLW